MNKKWFTRFEQDHVCPQYLANMRAATEYFYSWWPHATLEGFRAMLMRMHAIVSRGGYAGYTGSNGPLVAVGNEFRGVTKDSWRPVLKKEWFRHVPDTDKIYPALRVERLCVRHHLVNQPRGYELHLPDGSDVPDFLNAMASNMSSLSRTFSSTTLANYIQYFVVGHPFESINFSICMAQTNAILYHYGFEPLYHKWFDFDCFVYDCDRIERIFAARLERRRTA